MTITGRTWKNSLCSPMRRLELQIRFTGKLSMNREGEIAVFGKRLGVFRAKNGNEITGGANWCYQGKVLGESQKDVETALREDPELASEITQKIREVMT